MNPDAASDGAEVANDGDGVRLHYGRQSFTSSL